MDGTLKYNNQKVLEGVAIVIGTENIEGDSLRDIENVFADYEMRNIRSQNVAFQMSINPDPASDRERYTDQEILSYATELMSGLGYGNQPIVIYKHQDIEREHYHVVSIRTDANGKKIRDYNEEYNVQSLMKRLAEKYHYTPAGAEENITTNSTKQQNNNIELKFNPTAGNVREQYKNIFDEALKWHFTTYKQFETIMKAMGVGVIPVEGNEWRLYLQGLDKTGEKAVGRISETELGVKMYELQSKTAEKNKAQSAEISPEEKAQTATYKKRLGKLIGFCLKISKSEKQFEQMLLKRGIAVTLSRKIDGSIFGSTFADTNSKTAYKGSELGLPVKLFLDADDQRTGQFHTRERDIRREEVERTAMLNEIKEIFPDIEVPEATIINEENNEQITLELVESLFAALGSGHSRNQEDIYTRLNKKKKKKVKHQ